VNEKPLKVLCVKNIYRETLSDTSKLAQTCFKEQNFCRLPNLGKTRKQLGRAALQNLKEHVYTKKPNNRKNVFLHRPKRFYWWHITCQHLADLRLENI
jgi:hypothetical protein